LTKNAAFLSYAEANFFSSKTLRKFNQNATQSASWTSSSAIFSITGSLASSESNLLSTASNREIASVLKLSTLASTDYLVGI